MLAAFDDVGVPVAVTSPLSAGANPALDAGAVVAGLPAGAYAVAWNDLSIDGDELGVALRRVEPAGPVLGSLKIANVTTAYGQRDPDVLWTGTQLVVAWVDDASASTGPDVRYRTFSANLAATSVELTLADTIEAEGQVVLAPFGASWAAAWRSSAPGGLETIEVKAGTTTWSVGPFFGGPYDDKPALAQLDATHLLLVFTETDVDDVPRLRCAFLDTTAPGDTGWYAIDAQVAGMEDLGQAHPNAVAVGTRVYVGWRSDAVVGGVAAEDLWLKEIDWQNPGDVNQALGALEVALPRYTSHGPGDQRRPALAASPLAPEGALVAAWEDYGHLFGANEGSPDTIVELIPMPMLRLNP